MYSLELEPCYCIEMRHQTPWVLISLATGPPECVSFPSPTCVPKPAQTEGLLNLSKYTQSPLALVTAACETSSSITAVSYPADLRRRSFPIEGDTTVFVDPRRRRVVYSRLSLPRSSPFPYRRPPPPIQRKIGPSSVPIPGTCAIYLCVAPAYPWFSWWCPHGPVEEPAVYFDHACSSNRCWSVQAYSIGFAMCSKFFSLLICLFIAWWWM
jgi:hypothetical protein